MFNKMMTSNINCKLSPIVLRVFPLFMSIWYVNWIVQFCLMLYRNTLRSVHYYVTAQIISQEYVISHDQLLPFLSVYYIPFHISRIYINCTWKSYLVFRLKCWTFCRIGTFYSLLSWWILCIVEDMSSKNV